MCATPITIKRTYRTMSGEFTNVVPCGKCLLCLRRRQSAWAFRLSEHNKIADTSAFLTLTYDELCLPYSQNGLPTLKKVDLQEFWKKVRRDIEPTKIKYYACGEYGTKSDRPHYHAIVFDLPKNYLQNGQRLADKWGLGHIRVDVCNGATINYVTKYVMKGQWQPQHDQETGLTDDRVPQYAAMSKNLGLSHLTPAMKKYYQRSKVGHVTLPSGVKLSMPRYYREKVYNKKERQIIAVESKKVQEAFMEQQFADAWHRIDWVNDLDRRKTKIDQQQRNKL